MKDITPSQSLVSNCLARVSQGVLPEFHEAFMKAMLLSLRVYQLPVSLVSRDVDIYPSAKQPRRLFALVIDDRPIGLHGHIGWKAIAQDALPASPKASIAFRQSINHATRWQPPSFRNNIVVQAMLSSVKAEVAAALIQSSTPTPEQASKPVRL